MPCYSYYTKEELSGPKKTFKQLKQDVNTLTRLLCESLNNITEEQLANLSIDLQDWKKQHDLLDKLRKAE